MTPLLPAESRRFAAGDAEAAAALLHTDVVLEDMTLRTRLLGRIETSAHLVRVLADVPYGRASALRARGRWTLRRGFEWTANDGLVGITAIELDVDRLITRITSVYDGRQVPVERRTALLGATFAS